jgi:outer membrane protein insertion porin family
MRFFLTRPQNFVLASAVAAMPLTVTLLVPLTASMVALLPSAALAQSTPQPTPKPTPTPTPATPNPSVGNTPINPNLGNPSNTPTVPSVPLGGGSGSPLFPSGNATPPQEPLILVSEIVVRTPDGQPPLDPKLESIFYGAITSRPGTVTTRSRLQEDINAVFRTGYFSPNIQAEPEDTELGVRIVFSVLPNPILKTVKLEGATVVTQADIDRIFESQYGQAINLNQLKDAVGEIEKLYKDRGYELAKVRGVKPDDNGGLTLSIAEGQIEDIRVSFIGEEGKTTTPDGKPVQGYTRPFIITRELRMKAGDPLNRNALQSDMQRVFGLGLFEDLNVSFAPGNDPDKVVVQLNVKERNSGSIAAGAGLSSATGLFGTLSFQQQNLGGNNQRIGLDTQIGERELLFDLNFTDPWLAGDPNRTSFSANIFNRRVFSFVFDSPVGIGTNNDTPRINRYGLGFSFSRPLDESQRTTASAGLRYERVAITDSAGTVQPFDSRGNPLSTSSTGQDDLLLLQFALATDRRDNAVRPTSGNVFRIASEQSVPIGNGSIFMNRLRASYSHFVPVQFTNFSEGPQALAFNLQAGTVMGTLPPYEAFQIGGSNSVRGWDEGKIGSGRSFAIASAEYRFPVFNIVGGVLFADYGTDLGSGSAVPGNPAATRNKPGSGGGYGVGLRIQTPLGSIRVDYGFSTSGSSQFSFGLGEKF